MQGRSSKPEHVAGGRLHLSTRVFRGVLAMIFAVAAVSLYTFWRVDRVQENVEALNRFYVPTLKHLNLISGKWLAYQRSFEQSVGFRKWGKSSGPVLSKLRLKKMVEGNLAELRRIEERFSRERQFPEREALSALLTRLTEVVEHEAVLAAEIESHLQLKRYDDAARLYSKARQDNIALTRDLASLNRDVESRVAWLQLSTEQELRQSQAVMLLLLGFSLLFSLFVLSRLGAWLKPVGEWTRVAQQIALKGLSREITFPQIQSNMPPEMALLTCEFTRMGLTVLERERTISSQKNKLESLNGHLKEQNLMLRKLGGLNERVLNSMSSGLLVISADGRVEQFNERYCELFSAERHTLMHQPAEAVLKSWPATLRARWLNRSGDEPVQDRVTLEQGGFEKVYDVRVQPLHHQAGCLILFEDVTRVVEAERKLEHAKRLVLAGNLSSQVAHEVRNPLNSMTLQLEMLREDLADGIAAGARISAIEEQVSRLERITARYLEMRKASGGTVSGDRVSTEAVNMHHLVERCLSFLSGEIQAGSVRVELALEATNPVVKGDPDALAQVLFNLVRNALEAMAEARVSARASHFQEAPRLVIRSRMVRGALGQEAFSLMVEDSGPGIDAQTRARIFEPFFTRKATGHGLGLSLSRQVCIDHGGELRLNESDLGQGAVFEMLMPMSSIVAERGSHAPNPGC